MPQVKVTYNGNTQTVFVDLDDSLEIFRIQLLSIFEVDVSEQRYNVAQLHTSPETTTLRQVGWTDTSIIELVLTKAVRVHQPTAADLKFLGRIKSSYGHVKSYSNGSLQQFARDQIPQAELEKRARERIASAPSVALRDALLLELLNWFKKDFFKWVNQPNCGSCGSTATVAKGVCPPSAEEQLGMAGVTEMYMCQNCAAYVRFPRYNNPRTLLTWRQGRCGEGANCFTLCCIALGFEARHIVDWTDHVWTEVWSDNQQRWLHCDPCENKCDIPLLYEAGWGKKLNYVLAFSENQVSDVTKRYTRQWDAVSSRRTLIDEAFLQAQLNHLNETIASQLPVEYLPTLFERTESERKELEQPLPIQPVGLEGRISGSLEWRIARGEIGPDQSSS